MWQKGQTDRPVTVGGHREGQTGTAGARQTHRDTYKQRHDVREGGGTEREREREMEGQRDIGGGREKERWREGEREMERERERERWREKAGPAPRTRYQTWRVAE